MMKMNCKKIIETLSRESTPYSPIIFKDGDIIDPINMYERSKRRLSTISEFISSNDTIVDLGCNIGYYLREFRKLYKNDSVNYIGIDSDKIILQIAKLLTKHEDLNNIEFRCENINNYKDESDVTLLMQLPYPFQFSEYLLEVLKSLKSKTIICECGRSPKYIDSMMSIETFEKKLSNIMDCKLILTTPDHNDGFEYMYKLEK